MTTIEYIKEVNGPTFTGEPLTLPNCVLDFVISCDDGLGLSWHIYELSTALIIGVGNSKEEAFVNACDQIQGKEREIEKKLKSEYGQRRYYMGSRVRFINDSPALIALCADDEPDNWPLLYTEAEITKLKQLHELATRADRKSLLPFIEEQITRRGKPGHWKCDFDFLFSQINQQASDPADIDVYLSPSDVEPTPKRLNPEQRKALALTKTYNKYQRERKRLEEGFDMFKHELIAQLDIAYEARVQTLTARYDALNELEKGIDEVQNNN